LYLSSNKLAYELV